MVDIITWDESLNIGVDEIDNQHKKWIILYNDLLRSMQIPNDINERKEIIKKMLDYTDYHFKTEQEYMEQIGYPDVVQHIRFHKEFTNEVYNIYRSSLEEQYILKSELLALMKKWIYEHIATEDKKILLFLEKET